MNAFEHMACAYRLQAQSYRELAKYHERSPYGSSEHNAGMAAHYEAMALSYLDMAHEIELDKAA